MTPWEMKALFLAVLILLAWGVWFYLDMIWFRRKLPEPHDMLKMGRSAKEASIGMRRFAWALTQTAHLLAGKDPPRSDWFFFDTPRWWWPDFSPSPQRPFDWRID